MPENRRFTRRQFIGSAACSAAALALAGKTLGARKTGRPNLVIIHTDEHNFRTLGCCRDMLSNEQAYMWGEGLKVETPHIDSIAKQGAIATSCYSSSPVCSPSRSSLQTGLYPQATAVKKNNIPMLSSVKTFANVLQEKGYATTYLGKWHLDGYGKPQWDPKRNFGYQDNRYMFNRGHWKKLIVKDNGGALPPEHYVDGKLTMMWKLPSQESVIGDEKSFTTDFLCDRTIQAIERDKDRPFCVMCSIPDPHGPDKVRSPYNKMYDKDKFEEPRTLDAGKNLPGWLSKGKNWTDGFTESQRNGLAEYFGMVKCIDDNVGKILAYLKRTGLEENTIVVFTSDHGDLMGEHNRHNKGLPYETSARIPFVIKYPGKIKPGKIVRKANTNTDFAPTILSLMGFEGELKGCHGEDISKDFTSHEKIVDSERIVYFRHANENWAAAVSSRYKLVLSTVDRPWLFDLEKDPDELINFYNKKEYAGVAQRFKKAIVEQMKKFEEPMLKNGNLKMS
ncbi:Choline-sulfatase [Sedimentisphaera cyanobacteriorum]|uniref:Choline-sulfatase n=1 Tax=Sedimentisphaera cyanobacteriorum TaxID=1940790 RepID=A0A1Q2HRQ8_9BACT|nr:sulfatase-like hydrolase/transferase [Sedimentisphaera cyanobacteriorum]AQQ09936.1 Choline-sulfatase [Sedimentisphaera cyanobacteriorum]